MIAEALFWLSLAVGIITGWTYFRDLGDVTQMFLKVKRENVFRAIRREHQLLAAGGVSLMVMVVAHGALGAGPGWAFWPALLVLLVFLAFPYVWVHLGLRNQQRDAKYFSVDEASRYVNPTASVLVLERNGVARAHPDYELMRPHLAGDPAGLDGENVVMTYCALGNVGLGYVPEIDGSAVDLDVLAQHGNNLVLRDRRAREPIQQIYGFRDGEGNDRAMRPWPTFRMSFRAFARAYPNGRVYLNRPTANVLLKLLDVVMDAVFTPSIARQHRQEAPIMDNMTRHDGRLPNKTYVWGIDLGDDAVCYTEDFVVQHGGPVNVRVGDRDLVVAYDPMFESLGAFYNDTGVPASRIDFFGESDQGQLERVERLKPGVFWHVWAEFFPHTDINRASS